MDVGEADLKTIKNARIDVGGEINLLPPVAQLKRDASYIERTLNKIALGHTNTHRLNSQYRGLEPMLERFLDRHRWLDTSTPPPPLILSQEAPEPLEQSEEENKYQQSHGKISTYQARLLHSPLKLSEKISLQFTAGVVRSFVALQDLVQTFE